MFFGDPFFRFGQQALPAERFDLPAPPAAKVVAVPQRIGEAEPGRSTVHPDLTHDSLLLQAPEKSVQGSRIATSEFGILRRALLDPNRFLPAGKYLEQRPEHRGYPQPGRTAVAHKRLHRRSGPPFDRIDPSRHHLHRL